MKIEKILSKLVAVIFIVSLITVIPANQAKADAFKNVTLGGDLTQAQKEEMLKYFGVTKQEANVIEVNINEETKYLGNVASKSQIGTKSISCSYVEPTDKGGLNVSTNNIYWVNGTMIKNALITAGIQNANVKVAAPFNVSGTAALTGILKGFESGKDGKKIDEAKKTAANEELVTTGNLGEKIGKDQSAALMNEIKKEVIKEKPEDKKDVAKIVTKVSDKYNYNLSKEDMDNITNLMYEINKLNLNYGQLKSQLNGVTSNLKGTLTSEKSKSSIKKACSSVKKFFSSIF